ncbi:hypothetical protein D918_00060 [Trichuris suis]|nr:hypothetical protein D918_00060 [Trichuris suis]
MQPLAKALMESGHVVTILQIADKEHPLHDAQCTEQVWMSVERVTGTDWNNAGLWSSRSNGPAFFTTMCKMTAKICSQLIRPAPNKHGVMNDQLATINSMYAAFANLTATAWDLVIVDSIFAPCGIYVALQGHFVDYSTTIMYYKSAVAKRITSPLSVRPGTQMASFESKRFLHRLLNTCNSFIWLPFLTYIDVFTPLWSEGRLFGAVIDPFSFYRNSAFTFVTVPPSLNFAQPTSNEVIVVDHPCQKENSSRLPDNYRQFIEQPNSKGTILVAFGHAFEAKSIPEQVRQAMLGAFLRLSDYRIIWQPAEQTDELNASHIWPNKWVPQSDILAHPKTVAFVTHMGYKSFREGLCAQVPLVAMPIFAEQYFNTAVALQKGIGVFVNKMNISSEGMYRALHRVLNDRTIKQRMTRFSSQVNDQFVDPVDLATFWINFLLRRKNVVTKFLRQKGEDLNNIAMDNSDVLLFFASIVGILFVLIERSD